MNKRMKGITTLLSTGFSVTGFDTKCMLHSNPLNECVLNTKPEGIITIEINKIKKNIRYTCN